MGSCHEMLLVSVALVFVTCGGDEDGGTSDEGAYPRPPAAEHQEVCTQTAPEAVAAMGGAFTLAFDDGLYWIFGETLLGSETEGYTFLSSTGAVTGVTVPDCQSPFDLVTDTDGAVVQLIPLTGSEMTHDTDHPEEGRTVLWPVSGFVHDEVGYIWYRKALVRDYFDLDWLGTGLATVSLGGVASRLAPGIDATEPTLHWVGGDTSWAEASVVGDDGYLYVYGCTQVGDWDTRCAVVRAALQAVIEPGAYQYYTGDDTWSGDEQEAAWIFEGTLAPSVVFDEALGTYLAVYAEYFSNDVVARAAPTPWGPWSEPRELFTGVEPADWFIRDVQVHPALSTGSSLLVTYHTEPEGGSVGMHLVSVDFGD